MKKIDCTVLIAAKNEELNLPQCLKALGQDFHDVIVIDSYSTDSTRQICESFNAKIIDFPYVSPYPKKRQWALDNIKFSSSWVLLLDADEIVTDDLKNEIRAICPRDDIAGVYLRKQFHFLGRRLRFGGFDFRALMMFRPQSARFEKLSMTDNGLDMEIHERLIISGKTLSATNGVDHLDWNGFRRYIDKHNSYSEWESDVRIRNVVGDSIESKFFGDVQERRRFLKLFVRRLPCEPLIWFLYHFVFRFGFLEGRLGFIAACTRAFYIFMVRVKIYERLRK